MISPPYNLPDPVPPQPPMTGFVTDYFASYPPDLANPPSFGESPAHIALLVAEPHVALLALLQRLASQSPAARRARGPDRQRSISSGSGLYGLERGCLANSLNPFTRSNGMLYPEPPALISRLMSSPVCHISPSQ